MIAAARSACPINRSLELLGDRWSVLILRDIALHDRQSFREIMIGSEEGISAPVLSRRLTDLVKAGFLSKAQVRRGQQGSYRLTELGLATIPLLVSLAQLGMKIDPSTEAHGPAFDHLDDDVRRLRRQHLAESAP